MISKRKLDIFKAIVEEFVATAEPVGSKTLVIKYGMDYSSATIRSEMNELENLGLLEKTHTSSGRVPSTQGYRFYAEHLMESKLDKDFAVVVRSVLEDTKAKADEVIRRSVDILSQMTNMTSLVLGPEANIQRLEHIKLLPLDNKSAVVVIVTDSGHTENKLFRFEDKVSVTDLQSCTDILNQQLKGTRIVDVVDKMKAIEPILAAKFQRHEILFKAFLDAFVRFANDNVYTSGETNLLYQPDFADVEKLKSLMNMLQNHRMWRDISEGKTEIVLQTSKNSQLAWVNDLAVISSTIRVNDGEEAKLMLVGPSRMDYDRVVSLIDYLATSIEEMFFTGGRDEEEED